MKTWFQFKSIRDRLVFWFLLVALAPLLTISVINYQQRVAAIEKRAFEKLVAVRELKLQRISSWLDEKFGNIETLSEDPEVRSIEEVFEKETPLERRQELTASIRETMQRFIQNYRDYMEVYILHPVSGRIEISTSKSMEGEDRSQNLYFTEPLRTGEMYIKDIFYSTNLNIVSMTFSMPIYCRKDAGRDIAGILVVRFNLENSVYALLHERAGMGQTGETLILNKDLMALSELRGQPQAPLHFKLDDEPARLAAQGKTGIARAVDYNGREVLAAYGYVPRTGWGFIAKQDMSEIYGPIRPMLNNLLFMLFISIAAVVMLSVLLSRAMARPVIEMTGVAKRIQEGDLSARNMIFLPDELGFLSESFNRTADSLMSQIEIQRRAADITETMVSVSDLETFRKLLVEKLMAASHSHLGAYFLYNKTADKYEHFYSVGADRAMMKPFDASFLEGQIGHVLASKTICHIKDIPEDTVFIFKTFAGAMLPKEIISIPVLVDDKVMGVIALASVHPYSKECIEIISRIWIGINIAFANLRAGDETRKLAEQLQHKNLELDAQARQLKAQTEELMQQSNELQRQNIELEIQKIQVEEANRLKNQFLSNMSHELRTPLNSVLALSRVLIMQAGVKLSEEEAGYLEIIERNGKNLLTLINDILDLAKIEAGKMDVTPKFFSPLATVEMIAESLEPIASQKGVFLNLSFPEAYPYIESDEARVHQIFQNIIGNAVKFTDKGSVTISGSSDGDTIRIEVKDTGIGIPEKELPFIFEEFRQVDGSASRKYEGTGLGLAIAYNLAKILNGTISVESSPGMGSTFTVILPVQWKGASPAAVEEKKNIVIPLGIRPGRKTVLVVDDDSYVTSLISNSLFTAGYNAVTASTGMDALVQAERHSPFAITLDIIMPDMDGWEVLQRLKQNPATSDIPVIIISITDDKETGLALGAVGYITKPVNKDALISEIRKIGQLDRFVSGPPHILVTDDNEFERNDMARMIEDEGMNAITADNGTRCLEILKEKIPDVLVLDLMMPETDGFQVLENLRADAATVNLPVIIVTAKDLSHEEKEQLRGNVSSILTKSGTTSRALLEEIKRILAQIESFSESGVLTQAASEKAGKILLVEDNDVAVIQIKAFLESSGFAVDAVCNGEEAIAYVRQTIPAGIILDLMMPGIDGFDVLEKIRSGRDTAGIPVLVLTAKDLTKDDLSRLSANNIQQLVQKGDIDQEGLLSKVRLMLGISGEKPDEKKKQKEGTPTIAVIEDNDDNMVTIRAVLQGRYNLIEATDGEEGLNMVFSSRPDLVLLDMALPGMDGLIVAAEIKKLSELRHIPVIALTAHAMKGDEKRILSAGCDDYMSKPFDPAALLKKIETWLEK